MECKVVNNLKMKWRVNVFIEGIQTNQDGSWWLVINNS